MFYAANILICCCRNSWQDSLIIFGSIVNIQNVGNGGFDTNYASSYRQQFGNKGDASEIKAKLNEDAMAILRKTNFHYGMRPVPYAL